MVVSSIQGPQHVLRVLSSVLDYVVDIYTSEHFETEVAETEAHKLLFSVVHASLGQQTIAQWLSGGGEERKAREAARDYVDTAKKKILDDAKAIEEAKRQAT